MAATGRRDRLHWTMAVIGAIDHRGLGASKRACAVVVTTQPNRGDPLIDQPGTLAGATFLRPFQFVGAVTASCLRILPNYPALEQGFPAQRSGAWWRREVLTALMRGAPWWTPSDAVPRTASSPAGRGGSSPLARAAYLMVRQRRSREAIRPSTCVTVAPKHGQMRIDAASTLSRCIGDVSIPKPDRCGGDLEVAP